MPLSGVRGDDAQEQMFYGPRREALPLLEGIVSERSESAVLIELLALLHDLSKRCRLRFDDRGRNKQNNRDHQHQHPAKLRAESTRHLLACG